MLLRFPMAPASPDTWACWVDRWTQWHSGCLSLWRQWSWGRWELRAELGVLLVLTTPAGLQPCPHWRPW